MSANKLHHASSPKSSAIGVGLGLCLQLACAPIPRQPLLPSKLGNRWIPPPKYASANAPPLVLASPVPIYKIYSQKTPSSMRTQAADVAHVAYEQTLNPQTLKKRRQRANQKDAKRKEHLIQTGMDTAFAVSEDVIANHTLVFDGGAGANPPIIEPPPKKRDTSKTKGGKGKETPMKPWRAIHVETELKILDTLSPEKGLIQLYQDGTEAFLRIPRKVALEMTGMDKTCKVKKYCESLAAVEGVQRTSLVRSKGKTFFTDSKMCNVGTQACRNAPGVRDSTYHSSLIPQDNWHNLVQTMVDFENVVASYTPTQDLRRLNLAHKVTNYKRMRLTNHGEVVLEAKIFSSLVFAKNTLMDTPWMTELCVTSVFPVLVLLLHSGQEMYLFSIQMNSMQYHHDAGMGMMYTVHHVT